MSQPPAPAPTGTAGAAASAPAPIVQQSSMRHYFASSKAIGSGGGSGSGSSGSVVTPDRKQTLLRASLEGGGLLSLAPAAASAAAPVAHSSLPFAHPPSNFSSSAPASSFSSPPSSASVSPAASVSSSASSSARRRKRERHSDDSDADADAINGTGGVAAAAAQHLSALSPCVCKLPARTLLYQLHVLRADEKMVIRGVETRGARVGGGGGVELRVQSAAEQEAEEAALEAADAKLRAAAASVCASSSHASHPMCDGEEKGEPIESAESDDEEEEEVLEPLSAALPALAHPLFPESQEFVSLFLSASAAHARFQQLRAAWSARGVRNIRARVMEFQLTHSVQLLMVANEAQKRAWLGSAAAATPAFADRMDDDATPSASSTSAIAAAIPQPSQSPLRASPFSKPTPTRSQRSGAPAAAAALFAPGASSTASTAASHSSPVAAPAAANSSQSSLYAPPVVPPALRSVLDSRDDTLSGFCISAALGGGAGASATAPTPGEVVEASESNVLGGEVTLQSGVCAQRLHILDDDKKGRWSQQLLTDLFGRMDMGKQHAPTSSASSSSSSGSGNGRNGLHGGHSVVRTLPFHQLSVSGSAASFSPSPSSHVSSSLQLAPSSFAPHVAAGLLQPLHLQPPPRA